ncbi:MAG: YlxR family protein [Thermaerobacter sp.]|nr:YlxR family protein [Thermaerobacter sp.]MDA8205542.1 YlxR family protein [Thermaerobacter sp.]
MVTGGRARRRPIRSCVACGRTADKRDLIRVVRSPDGVVSVDATGKKSGRGAYLCPVAACLDTALKSRRLERGLSLPTPLPEQVVASLRAAMADLTAGAPGGAPHG